jgi:RNA polymerase sigma factor (sigma-70 family)
MPVLTIEVHFINHPACQSPGESMSESQTIAIQAVRTQDDDARLILEAQKNPALFQTIYEQWATPVYQYFHFRTGDMFSAEDLTSQLFLTALQALPRYRHQGHFAAWLFTIARNLANDHYRAGAREVPLEQVEQVAAPHDPAGEVAQADEIRYLRKVILQLPDEEQELIRLRYVAELSFADMAIILNRREDAVKKSLYRLQARLQSLLELHHA